VPSGNKFIPQFKCVKEHAKGTVMEDLGMEMGEYGEDDEY
jgi:hypothetical protein